MVGKAILILIITILLVVVQADDDHHHLSPSYPPAAPYPLFSSVDKINPECVKRCEIHCLAVPERLSPLCVQFLTVIKCWRHPKRDLSAAIKACVLRCLPPTAEYRLSVPAGGKSFEAFAATCYNKCKGEY
ncbi:uncharacterized protein LOC133862288 [Alnus glutinosa]|uniref:uncharacterized protein LOC133862288 n=1 Tax=Alnus glutinosa TaxID=3517 RepID=UPI002D77D9F9|nr:uncharacterized protein LOC133862288 [Alnus glutinosa]